MSNAVKTTCPYCGVGCGLVATKGEDEKFELKGDVSHPANFGRLCSKGAALGETLSLEGRLLHPVVDGKRASWESALNRIAHRFSESIEKHGPDSVAMYVSGQLLTEDYYVANKFMKGFVGSANIDTNSRLCMASTVAGHKRAFGSDTVPGRYEDLEQADLVVLAGSNLAWCHPVLHQRLLAAREERGIDVIVIDPRRTETCNDCDLHLALEPGSDVALWNGLLGYLVKNSFVDESFLESHVDGFFETNAVVEEMDIDEVARVTKLPASAIRSFYAMFATTERVVTVFSQGINQSTSGVDKVNAIINSHLATGRIGKVGMGPFSVTGQPNAMGGREVGGLANMLAAHMDIENKTHQLIVKDFWGSPKIAVKPGLKAVEMFQAVQRGDIKVLWIMATNPAASMPEALEVHAALRNCPCVIVSDVVASNETLQFADIRLPSLAWGEKEGSVTNSERCISRQRQFLTPPGESRADWWQVTEVAKRMDFGDAFAFDSPKAIWHEYVKLTTHANDGSRDLDLASFEGVDYESMPPMVWGADQNPGQRFFKDGRFHTENHRAKMVPTPFKPPAKQASESEPFILITGRVRDQWHTMTRTGKSSRLLGHTPTPTLTLNEQDAERLGVLEGQIVDISNAKGNVQLPARISDTVREGNVFANIHWNGEYASNASIDKLVPANLDPLSGQPEFKTVPVSVKPITANGYGYSLSTNKPSLENLLYWVAHPGECGWQVEFALAEYPKNPLAWVRKEYSNLASQGVDEYEYIDASHGESRYMRVAHDGTTEIIFIAQSPLNLSREWLQDSLKSNEELAFELLAGTPGQSQQEKGPIVCACERVGLYEIEQTIAESTEISIEELGKKIGAGVNCGSCRPELTRLIANG